MRQQQQPQITIATPAVQDGNRFVNLPNLWHQKLNIIIIPVPFSWAQKIFQLFVPELFHGSFLLDILLSLQCLQPQQLICWYLKIFRQYRQHGYIRHIHSCFPFADCLERYPNVISQFLLCHFFLFAQIPKAQVYLSHRSLHSCSHLRERLPLPISF